MITLPPRPWIKVCGLSDERMGHTAVSAGANLLGVVLVSDSPRSITLETAVKLAFAWESPDAVTVAVVRDLKSGDPMISKWTGAVQCHGTISNETIAALRAHGIPIIRACAASDFESIAQANSLDVDALLVDGTVPGSGAICDWDAATRARRESRHPTMLAGGLTADNVAAAVRHVEPAGVDASSGLEHSRSVKDALLVSTFCANALLALRR